MRIRQAATDYQNRVNFHDSAEVGLILDKIDREVMSHEEVKALAKNLLYRISFYMKNRVITVSDNIDMERVA